MLAGMQYARQTIVMFAKRNELLIKVEKKDTITITKVMDNKEEVQKIKP